MAELGELRAGTPVLHHYPKVGDISTLSQHSDEISGNEEILNLPVRTALSFREKTC